MKRVSQILGGAAWNVTAVEEKAVTMIDFRRLLHGEVSKHQTRAEGCVVPDSSRCVQCGICSYSCPIGIDVRRYAWERKLISESYCLTCGECVARCPRGVLRFERSNLFDPLLIRESEV